MGPGTGQGAPSRTTPMDTLRALAGDITDFLSNRVEMVRANAPEMPSGTGRDRMEAIANRTPEEARAAYDAIWNNPFFGPMVMGIKAYHGSPYDFDRFDLSKIGTGEGAQAYGHGIYLAESEGVARSYRDALKNKALIDPGADALDPRRIAGELYDSWQGDLSGALGDAKFYDNARDVIAELRKIGANPPKGHMYEVDINTTPDRLLDWDKPLSEQPQARAAADRIFDPGWDDGSWMPTGEMLVGKVDGAKRAQIMRETGLDGIQYLDQGSRAAGTGSRNYVIFDDSLINILRKYGILAPLMGAGAVEAMGGAPEQ